MEPTSFSYPGVEQRASRTLYTATLLDLEPGTDYSFSINYRIPNTNSRKYFFRTIGHDDEIVIANGGDVGNNHFADAIHAQVRLHKPDLIVLGGDLSYGNNLGECYNAWDLLISRLPHRYPSAQGTRLVPVLYGVGNHDLGKGSNNTAIYEENEHSPIYKKFFPQHFGKARNVP